MADCADELCHKGIPCDLLAVREKLIDQSNEVKVQEWCNALDVLDSVVGYFIIL